MHTLKILYLTMTSLGCFSAFGLLSHWLIQVKESAGVKTAGGLFLMLLSLSVPPPPTTTSTLAENSLNMRSS